MSFLIRDTYRCMAIACIAGCLGFLPACQREAPTATQVLHVSAIPDQPLDSVQQQHGALVKLVCAMAVIHCEWTPASTYEEVVARMGRGEIDLAYFGGVTFVQAEHRYRAIPLAMRDIDLRFTSIVVVRQRDPARTLADLKGRKFSFGNRLSTSGHIMARAMLRKSGVEPERDFSSVAYSVNHADTLHRVLSGEADAGAVNASTFYKMYKSGDSAARGLRVVWQSLPYVDYVWAVRADLSPTLRTRLANAFFDLDHGVPEHAEALDNENALGYVPAFPRNFDEVREAAKAHGEL